MEDAAHRALTAGELMALNSRHVAAMQDYLSADLGAYLTAVDVRPCVVMSLLTGRSASLARLCGLVRASSNLLIFRCGMTTAWQLTRRCHASPR